MNKLPCTRTLDAPLTTRRNATGSAPVARARCPPAGSGRPHRRTEKGRKPQPPGVMPGERDLLILSVSMDLARTLRIALLAALILTALPLAPPPAEAGTRVSGRATFRYGGGHAHGHGYWHVGYRHAAYWGPYWGHWGWWGWWYPPAPRGAWVVRTLPRNAPATIETKIKPKKAEVWVDGRVVGQARDFNGRWDRLWVAPGEHGAGAAEAGLPDAEAAARPGSGRLPGHLRAARERGGARPALRPAAPTSGASGRAILAAPRASARAKQPQTRTAELRGLARRRGGLPRRGVPGPRRRAGPAARCDPRGRGGSPDRGGPPGVPAGDPRGRRGRPTGHRSRSASSSAARRPRTERYRFRRFLPGLKRIVLPGGMRTSRPVRGLRPMPFLRGLT